MFTFRERIGGLKSRIEYMKSLIDKLYTKYYLWKCGVRLSFPIRGISNIKRVKFGKNVQIQSGSWFALDKGCEVTIDEGTIIGKDFTISGTAEKIYIGKNVLISDRVFITESHHKYSLPNIPISKQGLHASGPVFIGDDCWLGINVCVMPGVSIGKHSVIGANAVVTKNIPPYSVAVGIPAKVIKKIKTK
jgi:acetyltransferase-like isoleucine patch superfamily enzyme